MPRQRRRKVKTFKQEAKHQQKIKEFIKPKRQIKLLIPIVLISIFFLVLFFNSYFNYTSGTAFNPEGTTLGTRFFVSGPDPYYNMRTCQETLEHGYYRFVTEEDPLLNYPIGHYGSSRPPLFNMIAISSANVINGITNMGIIDSLGWCMLFLPAIYGALLIFPVYGIGKTLFNKKVGIISAFFISLIPIHISSGHGSALSLFDHDSFLLLLFTITFYFMIKSLKEKNIKISLLYAALTGVSMAAIQMTWVSAYFIFILITLFFVVHVIFDILKGLKDIDVTWKVLTAVTVGFLLSLPYFMTRGDVFTYPFFSTVVVYGFTVFCYILKRLKVPWLVTIPTLSGILGASAGFLYLINIGIIHFPSLSALANLIFGEGIYGTKVALTIGEAHTFPLSQTVMSFGPALFWAGLAGFVLYTYRTYKGKVPPQNLFFVIVFIVDLWLTTNAGRFLNDLVPTLVIFSAFILWVLLDKLNYKEMIKNIKAVGGFKGIRKGVKITHLFGIFIVFILVFPNTFLALDAAVPPQMKSEVFGDEWSGSFGLGLGQSYIWADASHWMSLQDIEIENPEDKPGWISWWDYGFYIASMGGHPTVADNFQRGIQAAANFQTAASEKEAVAVLTIRIMQGNKSLVTKYTGTLDEEVKEVLRKYLGNESEKVIQYNEDPTTAPSYDSLIAPEWGNDILKVTELNAMYHDCCNIITNLSDENVTMLYHDMIKATGYSIRYYGIDQRDITSIFGVFPFLADKATHGFLTMEDDYFVTLYYDRNTRNSYTIEQFINLTDNQRREMDLTTITQRKDAFFDTFIYRTYYGILGEEGNLAKDRIPTYLLKHWVPVYIAPQIMIAKYYEGAKITGDAFVDMVDYNGATVYVIDAMGIPHDYDIIENGKFSVIAPAGNISLKLYMGLEYLGAEQSITITEEEAMREIESNKTATLKVNFSSVDISINGLNETMTLNVTSLRYPIMQFTKEVFNGNYTIDSLIPDDYTFTITNTTGYIIYENTKFLKPNKNTYKIEVK